MRLSLSLFAVNLKLPLKVNDQVIDDAILRDETRALRTRLAEALPHEHPSILDAKAKDWARDNVIERALLRQAALADDEPVPADVLAHAPKDAPAEEVELQYRIERLAIRHAGKIAPPRRKDVVEYYRRHRDQMVVPEAVRAAHIIKLVDETHPELDAIAQIHAVERRIQSGESFEAISEELKGAGAENLGWFPRGEMVPEFDAVVFALEPGTVSPVFKSPFGFHIAKVYERMQEHVATLEEAQPQIERRIMIEKHQKALERLCDYLRARATVEEVAI